MFNKGKSVKSICDSFTQQLKDVQESNKAKVQSLEEDIKLKSKLKEDADNEVKSAEQAIVNIEKMFGQS